MELTRFWITPLTQRPVRWDRSSAIAKVCEEESNPAWFHGEFRGSPDMTCTRRNVAI